MSTFALLTATDRVLGWSLRSFCESGSEDEGAYFLDFATPGAPAPGLGFGDLLTKPGAIRTASCSFPRMGAAARCLQACMLGGGSNILHVGCGDAALTKMLASKGLCVVGVDAGSTTGVKRGLKCVPFAGQPLTSGCLAGVVGAVGCPLDIHSTPGTRIQQHRNLVCSSIAGIQAGAWGSRGGYVLRHLLVIDMAAAVQLAWRHKSRKLGMMLGTSTSQQHIMGNNALGWWHV
eukprot:GHRR01024098.1.p1 GENE.GHRR01024098.1~~GHRR01024098.1.p1  ORF type:complete len:233 (-),score=64.10 GHRR01024098.1:298-996(-)